MNVTKKHIKDFNVTQLQLVGFMNIYKQKSTKINPNDEVELWESWLNLHFF